MLLSLGLTAIASAQTPVGSVTGTTEWQQTERHSDGTIRGASEESSTSTYAISKAATPATGGFAWEASLIGSGRWQSLCSSVCAGYFLSADWSADGSTGGQVALVERSITPPGMAELFANVNGLGAPAIWTQIDGPGQPPQISERPFSPSSPLYNRNNNSHDWAIPKDPASPRLQGSRTIDCGFTEVGDHTVTQTCTATATWDLENPYYGGTPETTIDFGPSDTDTARVPRPTFGFSSSEPGSSFECRVDTGEFAGCSSPHTTALLSDGPHTFAVRATDPQGNSDPSPASRSFTVDTTPPPPPPPPPPAPGGGFCPFSFFLCDDGPSFGQGTKSLASGLAGGLLAPISIGFRVCAVGVSGITVFVGPVALAPGAICAAGLLTTTLAGGIAGWIGADPPDPHYTLVTAPAKLPRRTIKANRALTPRAAQVLTQLERCAARSASLGAAMMHATERAQGASQAKDWLWLRRQTLAAARYAKQYAASLRKEATARLRVRRVLRATKFGRARLTARAVKRAQRQLKKHGLPRRTRKLFQRLGVPISVQQQMIKHAVTSSPARSTGTVATVFSGARSIPTLRRYAAAMQTYATELRAAVATP